MRSNRRAGQACVAGRSPRSCLPPWSAPPGAALSRRTSPCSKVTPAWLQKFRLRYVGMKRRNGRGKDSLAVERHGAGDANADAARCVTTGLNLPVFKWYYRHTLDCWRSRRTWPPRSSVPKSTTNAHISSTTKGSTTIDRKSTRLNSSHGYISYAVFCLKKKKKKQI